mgnify:CR=1 FL=1
MSLYFDNNKLFDAEGHLTDEGLYAIKDGTLDDLGALEAAEHLSFCDYCLLRYTAMIDAAPDCMKQPMRDLIPQIKEKALEQVEKINSDRKIRVGIGTIESGIKGIKHTYSNAQDAVKAGEIFKKDRVILEYMGMEIYSSINQMVVNFGDRLTRTVLKQLGETEKRVLAKYYKCKEDIAETARQLGMSEDDVKTSLNMVRINTGLDVNDTEDNFKLHFIMIAKKVLENDERIKKNR